MRRKIKIITIGIIIFLFIFLKNILRSVAEFTPAPSKAGAGVPRARKLDIFLNFTSSKIKKPHLHLWKTPPIIKLVNFTHGRG